jgi:hypothetical protein
VAISVKASVNEAAAATVSRVDVDSDAFGETAGAVQAPSRRLTTRLSRIRRGTTANLLAFSGHSRDIKKELQRFSLAKTMI